MIVILVNAHVKPEYIEPFITATIDNASNSLKEAGVLRFDIYQQKDDPTYFTFVEIYKNPEDPIKHRESAHFIRWRDTITDMLIESRSRTEYDLIYPYL